ncbi:hypothetical protein POJ06DRAFT_42259 [Lipomyces tetrasporus]|uniref:Uncharacterized protein n=1 Tax=Lipomyces tetrasporus TaxID=54092 RepID=A0AAD7QKP6_9ASCO|nr:uncharacterized protein POJ06DRAFT_42259 [Lipomyces tetrasporus]KAJ8096675.1 hypothetical protein POJ06DRAFT_42259 [Lipomyces tetrasporus]
MICILQTRRQRKMFCLSRTHLTSPCIIRTSVNYVYYVTVFFFFTASFVTSRLCVLSVSLGVGTITVPSTFEIIR